MYPDTPENVLRWMSSLEFGIAIYKRLATITDTHNRELTIAIDAAKDMLAVVEKEANEYAKEEIKTAEAD
jgi:hypothetical protein